MARRLRLLLPLLAAISLPVLAKTEGWLEIRAPHFIVVTNSGEKQARRVADQFERMRAVFQKRFPNSRIDAAAPIIVIAVKDKKDFEALEPQVYLAKGQINLAGLFLQAPDKNYILMRLDAEGMHPYAIVYHEYSHFVVRHASEWMPLWLNEGLAQFYENTEIRDKEVGLGEPSPECLMVLHQNRLLPLATLFTVDYNSPYYHEENKGTIFYAESWALTHYLMIKDEKDRTQHLTEYAKLVSNKVDAVTAATQSFGDLKALEKNLDQYVSQSSFYYLKMPGATEVDNAAFQLQSITVTEADAIRADFLAYTRREVDARALLDHVLKEEPNNVPAHETMGFLASQAGKYDEAEKWYEEAVKLDSHSFLAHYYFAAIAMRESHTSAERNAQIENSLRTATKLNPSFAPAFDQLAAFYGMQHKNLDEAAMLSLTAAELDPGNINIRLNRANLMMELDRTNDAIAVLQTAMKLSDKPAELNSIKSRLESIQQYLAARDAQKLSYNAASDRTLPSPVEADAQASPDSETDSPSENSKHGPRRTVSGMLKNVQCSYPAKMTLKIDRPGPPLDLRAANYYKVAYSALNFKPAGDLNPCKDLEGMKAKIDYFESASSAAEGQIIAIELTK